MLVVTARVLIVLLWSQGAKWLMQPKLGHMGVSSGHGIVELLLLFSGLKRESLLVRATISYEEYQVFMSVCSTLVSSNLVVHEGLGMEDRRRPASSYDRDQVPVN